MGKFAVYFVIAAPCVMTGKKTVIFLFVFALYIKVDKYQLVTVSLSRCLHPPPFGGLEKPGMVFMFL